MTESARPLTLKKSGISTLLACADRAACEELRTFLKDECRRIGPLFEPAPGQFGFYVYRHPDFVCGLIESRGGFLIETSDCST